MILYYIKIGVWIEVCLVVLILILSLCTKIYNQWKTRKSKKELAKLNYWLQALAKLPIDKNSTKEIATLRKHVPALLEIIPEFDKKELLHWPEYRSQIIKEILLPKARKWAYSKFLNRRYLAVNCYQFAVQEQDQPILGRLLQDEILLISLSTATIVVGHPQKDSINALIDAFSKARRLPQSLFIDNLQQHANPKLVPIVIKRLEQEQDPYVKAFCYRLLTTLPSQNLLSSTILNDLNSNIIDLKIAALGYYAHQPERSLAFLQSCLKDDMWQVRVTAIKLLAKAADLNSITEIGELLSDKEWWVRINAANALKEFGEKGVAILKSQNPAIDEYAYEAATKVLLTLEKDR